jgi:hypothetical protein
MTANSKRLPDFGLSPDSAIVMVSISGDAPGRAWKLTEGRPLIGLVGNMLSRIRPEQIRAVKSRLGIYENVPGNPRKCHEFILITSS